MAENNAILSIKDLEVQFTAGLGKDKRTIEAVKGISFDILPGERVAVVGESGSGKSTMAHAIIQLLPGNGNITAGSIEFNGKELVGVKKSVIEGIRGSGIGLVPQDPMSNLNPVHRIGKQVEEAIRANLTKTGKKKVSRKEITAKAAEALAKAGFPNAMSRMKQFPHEFSGGMRQRVLIAIGLANNPQLLIADEPTSALDVTVQKEILDHLEGLVQKSQTALLFITHDLGLAAERSEKIVVMYKGQIVEAGPSLEILKNPEHPYTKKLVEAAPSIASVRLVSAKSNVDLEEEKIGEAQDLDVVGGRKKLVTIDNLTKEFEVRGQKEKLKAVDNVTMSIREGRTTAIVGESGSGKSTVANMLLGLLKPTAGSIVYDGENLYETIAHNKVQERAYRRRVQPVFQNPYGSLDPMYSIGSAIREPLNIHQIGTPVEREKRVAELLDAVGLPNSLMHRYPNELSGGQRQRIAIARALAIHPQMIVLDEAVSALDVLVQEQILTLLNDLQGEMGLTYLFITHDLAVVRLVADNVVVMEHGKIVEKGATEDVFNHPQQAYTQNLLDAIPGRHLI